MLLKQIQFIICNFVLNLMLTDAHTTSYAIVASTSAPTTAISGGSRHLLHNVEATTSTTLRLSRQPQQSATNAYQPYQENISNDNAQDDAISQSSLTKHQTTPSKETQHIKKRDGDGTKSFVSFATEKDNTIDKNAGFLVFDPKEMPTKAVPNVESVNHVLLNLFPKGFTDIFGFSHASEPATTTARTTTKRTPSFKKFPASLDQLVKKLHRNSLKPEKPKNSVVYGIEATISKEYHSQPGHREVVAEKITLDGPDINEKDFLTHGDILKINTAATNSSQLPEEKPQPREVSGEVSDIFEDLMTDEEDNRLAESRNIYVQHAPLSANQQNIYYSDPQVGYNVSDHQRQNEEIYQQLNSLQELPLTEYAAPFSSPESQYEMARETSSGAPLNQNITSTYDQSIQYQQPDDKWQYETKQQHNESYQTNNVTPSNIVFVTISSASSDSDGNQNNKVSSDLEYSDAASQIQEHRLRHPPTQVEVQKSINVRNKLITEQNGRLLEMHETIYHDANNDESIAIQQQKLHAQPPEQNYVSLSEKPIHVQATDYEVVDEQRSQQQQSNSVPESDSKAVRNTNNYVIDQQTVDDPMVFIPVQGNPYNNQIYPAEEFMPQGYAVSYQEAFALPLHYQHFINHPYAQETIVEKPVPYPVEKVVEKVVEKHVPIEVERIVEKPIVKFTNKGVMSHKPYYPQAGNSSLAPSYSSLPNNIPMKVLQNYLMYKMMANANAKKPNVPKKTIKSDLKSLPFKSGSFPQNPKTNYPKNQDLQYIELYPPPPPPSQSGLNSRYIYNTLPKNYAQLAAPTASYGNRFVRTMPMNGDYNDDPRWRNGHVLKRSASNINQPNIEYGFKPPLVPSVEITDTGVPLNSNADSKQ